ncbi:hypothetical protein [Nocardia tengchongensis]|uniref:hypothetical protein n=1 Tax=Nocardia tengchongensis TaxID=2055889 RepID=UPI003681C863
MGMFLGLVAGLGAHSLVLGILFAVLASIVGWYLIAAVEDIFARGPRTDSEATGKWARGLGGDRDAW